jgi:threonine/homoserine/homoserine lactone efflux protein
MSYSENLALFALLVFGIIAIPGMDMLFVASNTVTGGRGSGLAATAGILAGGVYHTLWGTLGTRLLLALPGTLFTALQLAGAGYLGWIGLTLVRSRITFPGSGLAPPRRPRVAFRQGAITCILNPKAYVFVLAVYPQFLNPRFGPIWPQALAMGAVTLAFQSTAYGGLALLIAAGRERYLAEPGAAARAGRIGGAVILLVAALTALHAVA